MGESGTTFAQLLDIQAAEMRSALDEYVRDNSAQSALPAAVLGFAAEEMAMAADGVLKRDVFDVVFEAWAAIRDLHDYTDPVKHPPAERTVVKWGKCSLKAPQEVSVKLGANGVSLPVLRLTIDLAAEFSSLALTIQGGAIRKITPGTAQASVALKYRNTTLITPRKTPELTFERGIEFEKGLAIG